MTLKKHNYPMYNTQVRKICKPGAKFYNNFALNKTMMVELLRLY